MKFKVGDRVAMYGCGETASTFWAGDKGTITNLEAGPKKDTFLVKPDEWPDELHRMHPKQLRRLRKPRKHGHVAWAIFDDNGNANFFLHKKNAKSCLLRYGGELVKYREVKLKN